MRRKEIEIRLEVCTNLLESMTTLLYKFDKNFEIDALSKLNDLETSIEEFRTSILEEIRSRLYEN